MQLQTKSSILTAHCLVISNNNKYTLSPVVSSDPADRFIFASVQLDGTIIAYVLNLYAPASGNPQLKAQFFSSILNRASIYDILINSSLITFILGDYNYSYRHRLSSGTLNGTPPEWHQLLDNFYTDCFRDSKQVTWQRGHSSSIIDFIFYGRSASSFITETDQQYYHSQWTYHNLISIRYQFADVSDKGLVVFKANPFLIKNKLFRQVFARYLEHHWPQWEQQLLTQSRQQVWDDIKAQFLVFVKGFQIQAVNWRRKKLKHLQSQHS
ncbi:MAG: hypothetical protein EXX96DRAFT_171454 [Benjaminiella poitrasii]|nr:MAG: hypothetical protein EXX96DRAFT_171454 [Benjaminiella poitrasii]